MCASCHTNSDCVINGRVCVLKFDILFNNIINLNLLKIGFRALGLDLGTIFR